jgi:hypothetical protein
MMGALGNIEERSSQEKKVSFFLDDKRTMGTSNNIKEIPKDIE